MRKFTQNTKSNDIAGFSCLNRAVKVAHMFVSPALCFVGDDRSPFFSDLVNANVTAFIIGVLFAIGAILAPVTEPKVSLAIIQGLCAVAMIDEFVRRCVHHLAVHRKVSKLSVYVATTLRVKLLLAFRPMCRPVVLRKTLVIFCIDDCGLAPRKGYQLDFLIVWLSDFVTRHVRLGHGSYYTKQVMEVYFA